MINVKTQLIQDLLNEAQSLMLENDVDTFVCGIIIDGHPFVNFAGEKVTALGLASFLVNKIYSEFPEIKRGND